MSFPPKAIANRFFDLAEADGEKLTPMKLQKLVYYSHGWMLGIRNRELIDEDIEAWKFGPVIRSLFREFADFGMNPITERATDMRLTDDFDWESTTPSIDEHDDPDEVDDAKALTLKVWKEYGSFSAIKLSKMTHKTGSPWDQIYQKYNCRLPDRAVIPNHLIRDYFAEMAKAEAASA